MGGPSRRSPFRRLLVVGAGGFLGSAFIRERLEGDPEIKIVGLDRDLQTASERLASFTKNPRLNLIQADVGDGQNALELAGDVESVVNFVSQANYAGAFSNAARYLQIQSTEDKAAVPTAASMVVRIAPAYGPFQDPRQPIALMISRALQGKSVPVPKRDRTAHAFTFVEDVSDAIARVLWKGEPGRIYDIAASEGATFTAAAGLILRLTGRSERLIVRESNPAWYSRAHEFLDTRPLRQLGWEPRHSLVDGLQKTIEWFRANEDWWQKAGRTQA